MEGIKPLCQKHKEQKDPVLDLICINSKCELRGPLCHYCLRDQPHNHMVSEIMELDIFISDSTSKLNSIKIDTEEKYNQLKKELEQVQKIFTSSIKDISRKLNASFGDLINNFEDVKIYVKDDANLFKKNILDLLHKIGKFGNTNPKLQNDFELVEKDINSIKNALQNIHCLKEKQNSDINTKSQENNNSNKPAESKIDVFSQITDDGKSKKNYEKPQLQSSPKKKVKIDEMIKQDRLNKDILRDLVRLNESKVYANYQFLDIHAITFQLDNPIELYGFAHFGLAEKNIEANFEYFIFEGKVVDDVSNKIIISDSFVLKDSQENITKILFKNKIILHKHTAYTLKVINKTKNKEFKCFTGINGAKKVDTFNFFLSEKVSSKTRLFTKIESGQIPEFYFKYC